MLDEATAVVSSSKGGERDVTLEFTELWVCDLKGKSPNFIEAGGGWRIYSFFSSNIPDIGVAGALKLEMHSMPLWGL